MSNINVSGSLIQDAVNLCNGIINLLTISQKDIKSEYENAGRYWNDSKYQKLGEIVRECDSSIGKTINELNVCLVSLNKIKQSVDEYESINIVEIANASGNTCVIGTVQSKPSWGDVVTYNADGAGFYNINDYQGEGSQRKLLNSDLPKNSTILIPLETLPGNFSVKTDELGRVKEFHSPKVDFFSGDRSGYRQGRSVDNNDGLRGFDDGGHLYPRQWGGPPEAINLVPMDKHVNRHGWWRNMEQRINRELVAGNSVADYIVKPLWEGHSRRPYGFEVSYNVNGIKYYVYVDNTNREVSA